jgi:phage repressor protein C with HTH and peptisase S24 domain
VKSAYGIIVVGDSMAPEFEPGDVALVNPTLPPRPNVTCVFYSEPPEGGHPTAQIKRLVRVSADHWHVRAIQPTNGREGPNFS